MRLGTGEIKKIIDDAIARKGRDPLEYYWYLVEELKRKSFHQQKIESEKKSEKGKKIHSKDS